MYIHLFLFLTCHSILLLYILIFPVFFFFCHSILLSFIYAHLFFSNEHLIFNSFFILMAIWGEKANDAFFHVLVVT
jgi:hypothetical protein